MHLTKKEFDLLWLLIRNRNRVVTRDAILARLWDYDADVETRTVDVHIRALRRKLGDQRIETVVGLGYRFLERPEGKRGMEFAADTIMRTCTRRLTARCVLQSD